LFQQEQQKKANLERKQQFVKKLTEEKNIPKAFAQKFAENVDFANLDTDDKMNNYIEDVEKTVQEYDQERFKTTVENNRQPGSGGDPEKNLESIKKAAEERYQGSTEAEGKDI
jgi:hypothetical protein